MHGSDAAVFEEGNRIVERFSPACLVRRCETDERRQFDTPSEFLDGLEAGADEAGVLDQVAGRIAHDRQLREDGQLAAHAFRPGGGLSDLLRVPGEIAHRRVDLCKRDFHLPSLKAASGAEYSRRMGAVKHGRGRAWCARNQGPCAGLGLTQYEPRVTMRKREYFCFWSGGFDV